MRNKKAITAYKGFDKDLKCRDFQYEIGKEYEIDGEIKVCKKGFHACENPLEVFNYYLLDKDCDLARFCEVEQSGNIDKENSTTKICSSKIKIKAELKLANIIKAGVEWIKEKVKQNNLPSYSGDSAQIGSSGYSAQIGSSGYSAKIGSSGYSAKIGSSGDSAQIGSSGDSAKIGSSGDSAKIGSSGDYAKIGSSGYSAQIGSSGDYAQIGSSGYSAKIGSSGYSAKIGSSGDYAQIGSSGYSAKIGSSGDYAQIGSSGYSAKIGSSGYSAQIGSSGDYAQIGSSGNSAKIGSSGYSAQIGSSGKDCVICCAGRGSIVKAKIGSWITLAEWKNNKPVCVKTEYVDGKRIKEDTWYKLINGEFVEETI